VDALGINVPGVVAQLINFFILLVLLRLFLYGPVMRMLDERSRRVREGMEAAEASKEKAAETERGVRGRLDEARAEGQTLVGQAQETANRIQEEARQAARQETEALLARARREIELERDSAIAELRKEFGDLTISAAEKVIGQSLDRRAHQRLIDEVLAESSFKES
jgi:F-type H+-transporting ATPase subunit b